MRTKIMNEKIESDEDEDIVFEKAREFLRIIQSRTSVSKKQKSIPAEIQTRVVERKMVQFGVYKPKKLKTVKTGCSTLTPLQRRKLVRVKTPVISFQKSLTPNGLSEKEKEESVQKMLEHIKRMPKQETYIPPAIPMVFINKQSFDKDVTGDKSSHGAVAEFRYLTSEQELTTWKLLRSSPTNCNVFVGNLSYQVNKSLLLIAFEPFIVEQQQQYLKVRIVIDAVSGASKGYGFVQFPYRRAAELAIMCMQGFELFGREIQLGWGQEEVKNILKPEDSVKKKDKMDGKKVGLVVFDSFLEPTLSGSCIKKRKMRWDVSERSVKEPTEKLQTVRMKQSNVANNTEILRGHGEKERNETIKDDGLVVSTPEHTSRSKTKFADDMKLKQPHADGDLQNDLEITEEKIKVLSSQCHTPVGQNVIKKDTVSYAGKCLSLTREATFDARRPSSDKPIEWLTREQRAKMIEVVCQNLRKEGVKHHLGVFGTHFEADNSRLFVLFCQQLTLEELKSEFEKYGTVEININTDSSGLSKGSAIVQYVSSASAESALKRLHGKVLGSKPLMIKIAEPKRTHKTGRNMNLASFEKR